MGLKYTVKVGIDMANDKNEFDLDFDFEKEYGISPDFLADSEFDEDALLAEFLTADAPGPEIEIPEFGQEAPRQAAPVQEPQIQEPAPAEMEFSEDFLADIKLDLEDDMLYAPEAPQYVPEEPQYVPQEPVFIPQEPAYAPEEPQYAPQAAVPAPQPPAAAQEPPVAEAYPPESPVEPAPVEPVLSRAEQRRIRQAKKRKFKEVYLPAILAGISLVLILVFIVGSVSRGIANDKANAEDALQASKDAEEAEDALDKEAKRLLSQAQALAAGYNYQEAIALLDSFSGELTSYPELLSAKSNYSQQLTLLKEWNDPSAIANLSFHVLIADPARAFTNAGYGNAYNRNFVTTGEFEKILEQLYANGYVLVDLDDVVTATTGADGTVTYAANSIYLPSDKTPIMLTETMVNYFNYMIDSDDDGVADAGGGGFASRLVVTEDGEIKAEMVNADGQTVVGDYDFVPILENFIEMHPDFSYQGARATLAVCGKEGIFGYRSGSTFYEENDLDDSKMEEEIAGATKVAQALRDKGYTIACYTYENTDYTAINATAIQSDLQAWFNEVKPILGEVDVMVFARHIDISDYGSGNKFNVLYSAGFRYFIGASTAPWAEVTNTYFHQKRLLVTGTNMAYSATTFNKYFNAMSILDDQRGTIPT